MRNTVATIRQLQKECGIPYEHSFSSLNFAVTDGDTVVALR